jgi:hypothetical protein
MDHSAAIISAFIRPERVPRYLALLSKPGGREKLRAKLAHLADLDPRFATPLVGDEARAEAIERLLKAKGAPASCYCLSESDELDGRDLPLVRADGWSACGAPTSGLGGNDGPVVTCDPPPQAEPDPGAERPDTSM